MMSYIQNQVLDTTPTINYDRTEAVINNEKEIITVPNSQNNNQTEWYEGSLFSSFIFPALTAILILLISRLINKKRESAEIKKINQEIIKLQSENEKMKKSFQPIVIGALQSVQDKVIEDKIKALKIIIGLKSTFIIYPTQFDHEDGVVFTPNDGEVLGILYINFSPDEYKTYSNFHNEYSYLFPNSVLDKLNNLHNLLKKINETCHNFHMEEDLIPGRAEKDEVKNIIRLYDETIMSIRKDCHLDNSFIHDFIKENK